MEKEDIAEKENFPRPRVGGCVIIEKEGKVLITERYNKHINNN